MLFLTKKTERDNMDMDSAFYIYLFLKVDTFISIFYGMGFIIGVIGLLIACPSGSDYCPKEESRIVIKLGLRTILLGIILLILGTVIPSSKELGHMYGVPESIELERELDSTENQTKDK